jgi:hypothetical protein
MEKVQICQLNITCIYFRIKKQKTQNGINCTKITLVCVGFTFPLR